MWYVVKRVKRLFCTLHAQARVVVCPIELLTFQVKGIQKLYNNVLYVHTHNTTGNRVSNAEYIL